MNHGSLFSGIGGFDLAAQWMGWENVFQVEIDDYCNKVLEKNFPNVKRYGDIKEFKGERGSVDILTGGFPCQPFSHAGKRQGEADDRYLWPEYLRVIREIQPAYVVGENVAGLISMDDGKTLDGILLDLEGEGYVTEQFIIPACGVGAWHRRDRIWIIAYNANPRIKRVQERPDEVRRCEDVSDTRLQRQEEHEEQATGIKQCGENVPNTESKRLQGESKRQVGASIEFAEGDWWESEPRLGGMVARLSSRLDGYWDREPDIPRVATGVKNRVDRLKGLGNAIVPQVAYEIFKAIDNMY